MGLVDCIRARVRTTPPARRGDSKSRDIAWERAAGSAYSEDAFRYFLDIERKRSEALGRPFFLVLIDLEEGSPIDKITADKVFTALWPCVRETDFIGWYIDRRVVGAALTQRGDVLEAVVSSQVSHRVASAIRESLADMADAIQIRVERVPSC